MDDAPVTFQGSHPEQTAATYMQRNEYDGEMRARDQAGLTHEQMDTLQVHHAPW
jgi:hypothetical protein